MNLTTEALWRRLRTLIDFHQKLVTENKDFVRMEQVARTISMLINRLESLNKTNKLAQTVIQ